ncbi:MAG: peptide deformylase [Saprospiraceae bacterium]|nr:peptide deformylase [Saprospiraceae bacterium]
MVLPIVLYGNPVLKLVSKSIDQNYPDLHQLIKNMWDTMYFAKGVGLAAPQIGIPIRLFVIDSLEYYKKEDQGKGFKKVFLNAQILDQQGPQWGFDEGCLSIPKITAEVLRKPVIKIRYQDEQFKWHEEEYDDMNARIIQHEYDHIEGILFVEKISAMRKRIIQSKLDKIKRGIVDVKYPVKQ